MALDRERLNVEYILGLAKTMDTKMVGHPEVFSHTHSSYDGLTRIKIILANPGSFPPETIEDLKALKTAIEEAHELAPKFLFSKVLDPEISEDDYACIYLYFRDLVIGGDPEEGFMLEETLTIFNRVFAKREKARLMDVRFLASIVQAYIRLGYSWRGRKYALMLEEGLHVAPLAEGYDQLISFYRNVRNLPKAKALSEEAMETCIRIKKLQLGAEYAYRTAQLNMTLPQEMRSFPNDAEIERIFGEFAPAILRYHNYKPTLQIDPIEHTPEFAAAYDEVMEAVEQKLQEVGDLHLAFQRWEFMREEFAKRGIDWKDPHIMNPRVMFD